jgi:hypothetical protein
VSVFGQLVHDINVQARSTHVEVLIMLHKIYVYFVVV